jgi:hypothetical protein
LDVQELKKEGIMPVLSRTELIKASVKLLDKVKKYV